MNRRHIIFDLDGTLVDSAIHCAAILNEMLAARGSDRVLARPEVMPHMSFGGPHLVTTLLGDECGEPGAELRDFRARYAARPTPETCLYAGVRAGLARLADHGFTLAVCSNKPQGLCDKIVDELGLRPMFASVVGGRDDLPPKPDRAMLDRNLAEIGAATDDALLVGDSEVDEALAAAVGMPFWLVRYGYPGTGWQPQAEAEFDTFDGVTAALTSARPLRAEHQ